MSSLEGKIALVTGASGGLGGSISMSLAQQGALVVGTGINDQEAQAVSARFSEAGLKVYGKVVNVGNLESMEQLIHEVNADFGVVDILINNAGITRDNLMMRMKDEEWESIININLNSIFHMTKLCLRDMIKARWGRIVNISSVVGVAGNPGQANYAASKAGMIGFTKSLAYEVASRGITANCVAPGFIDTPMTQKLDEKQRAAILQRVPLGRLGDPNEIANAVSFLVAPESAYITGQTIHVNGGMFMA